LQPLLTADEVAGILGVSRKRVYDLVACREPGFNRKLPAIRFGVRGLRFVPADVEAWVREMGINQPVA
jgi:excisionase family DNA binding protein